MDMVINIISKDSKTTASDYTITQLVDNVNITLNGQQDGVINIINKSIYHFMEPIDGFYDLSKFPNNIPGICGIRIVDHIPETYAAAKNNNNIKFFIMSSYSAYQYIKERDTRPVIYIEDAVLEPPIIDMPKTDRMYTFCNPNNLDYGLLNNPNLDIYTSSAYPHHLSQNTINNMAARFIEWSIENVANYNQYRMALLSYNLKHHFIDIHLKSLNKLAQAFYFNQEVVTNFKGDIHPDLRPKMKFDTFDNNFKIIHGNTRELYDAFFAHDVIRRKLIVELNKYFN